MINVYDFESNFVRLTKNSLAEPLQVNKDFYKNLQSGNLGDFSEERLVSFYTFKNDWETWEIHPNGEEMVILLSGEVEFILKLEENNKIVHLNKPNTFLIVPKGIWHSIKK